jgi:hypothetical protein
MRERAAERVSLFVRTLGHRESNKREKTLTQPSPVNGRG